MITINILWIILFLAISLITTGIYFKKKALLLTLLGGSILLLTGLITLISSPIGYNTLDSAYVYGNNFSGYHWDYDTGEPSNPNTYELFHVKESVIENAIDSRINLVISWVMILLGLACIIGSAIKLYDSRYEEEDPEQIKIFD